MTLDTVKRRWLRGLNVLVRYLILVIIASTLMLIAWRVIAPTGDEPFWRQLCGWFVCWIGATVYNYIPSFKSNDQNHLTEKEKELWELVD